MSKRATVARCVPATGVAEDALGTFLLPSCPPCQPSSWSTRAAAAAEDVSMRLEIPGAVPTALTEFEGREICLGRATTRLESPVPRGAQFVGRADCLGRAVDPTVACRPLMEKVRGSPPPAKPVVCRVDREDVTKKFGEGRLRCPASSARWKTTQSVWRTRGAAWEICRRRRRRRKGWRH